MEEPAWSDNNYPRIDYQDISYYSAPKVMDKKNSLDEVDPQLLATFDKLGIPLMEQKRLTNVAVDAVFDSVSIATTFRAELAKVGVIFCSFSEAVKEYPELIKKYLGSVVSVCWGRGAVAGVHGRRLGKGRVVVSLSDDGLPA
jgi:Fe-S cluster assembly protein SufB